MALQVGYLRHPSNQEVNALLRNSRQNLEAARALQTDEENTSMSVAERIMNLVKGMLFGATLTTAFIGTVIVLKAFSLWSFNFIKPLIQNGFGFK